MSILFAALAASGHQIPLLFLIIGFLVGVLLFFLGFRSYREYRIVADTPIAPARSIPMGLVHVQGKATGDDRLSSPLTHVPCFYYKVLVERYVKKDKESRWETLRTDTEARSFYLQDATAKVMINPHNADFNVTRTFHGEIGQDSTRRRTVEPTLGVTGPSEAELLNYVTQESQVQALIEGSNLPGASTIAKVLEVDQSLRSKGIGISVGGGLNLGYDNIPGYRFTEECLLAEHDCNVLGTCVENPAAKDAHDRNLIQKGQNEKTFLITTKSEGQIEKSLRWKAFLLVFIGGAIIIGMAALALHDAGMF